MSLENAAQSPANPLHRRAGDIPENVPRDRWGRPEIMLPGGGSKAYTRASTLGGALEDQTNLGEWKKRVVAYGLARRRDLVLAAASCESWDHPDDKKRLADIAEQAMQFAEAGAAATIGTALHALTDRLDRGQDIPDVGEHRFALDAYRATMRHFTVHAIEQFIVCDPLETAGTTDRVLSPRGIMTAPDGTKITPEDRLIGDTKTAATDFFFGIKFCVQMAVYGYGVPYQHGKGRLDWPDGIAPRTDWGLIMHVPSGGSSARPYWVNLTLGWELAQLSVQVREWRKRKDLVVAAELPLDLLDLIESQPAGPGMRPAFEMLWSQYEPTGLWTVEHTEAVKRRLAAAG
jgi:hypothetical protein